MKRAPIVTVLVSLALAACHGKGSTTPAGGEGTGTGPRSADVAAPDPAQRKADLVLAEQRAYAEARPVFDQSCAGCHTRGGKMATAKKLAHLDLTSYPFGGEHADTITVVVRHVVGIDGAKPTMPKDSPGAVAGAELALLAAWADAYDAAEAGGAHADRPEYGAPDSADLPDDDD